MAQQTGAVVAEAEALITLGTFTTAPVVHRQAWLEKAISLAEAADLPATAARAHNNIAALLDNFCGLPHLSQWHYRRAAAHAAKRGSRIQQIMFLSRVGMSLLWTGDLAEVAVTLREVHGLLQQVEASGSSTRSYNFTEALLLRYEGRLAQAAGSLRALYDRAHAQGDRMFAASLSVYLGELLLELNDLDEAARLLEEGALIGDQSITLGPVLPHCLLVAVLGRAGDLVGSAAALDHARQAATTSSDYYAPIYLAVAEARFATLRGNPEVPACWISALDRLDAVGWRWYAAQARREWAAYLAAGNDTAKQAEAARLLDQAEAIFTDIGAPYYAEQARAERAALDVAP
jgi:tetratricopeptide (TPR) repeat protein